MSQLRLATLLAMVAAAGCYREAAQDTLPEPQYVSGPPGGAIDPASSYGGAYDPRATGAYDPRAAGAYDPRAGAYDPRAAAAPAANPDDDSDTDADDTAGSDLAPPAPGGAYGDGAAPLGPPAAPGNDDAVGDGDADAGDLTAGVNDAEIDATLDGYGQWVQTDDYGQVWVPDATQVGVDFTPYESGGSWEYTDAGWAFACDYPWGWLPFHYGRWAWFHGYWGWVPGYHWGPAWVEWRHGGGIVGWRPLAPHGHGSGHRWHGGDVLVRDHRHPEQRDAHWRFATTRDFARPHIRSHLFGNPAEGLRVTSAVAAPPLRGRNQIRAADLMRNRVVVGGARGVAPGSVRDHRPGLGGSAGGSFAPPTRYRPPVRVQPGQLPVRSYPPGQAYQPPGRPYPGQTYQPPVRTSPPAVTPGTQRPPYYQPYPGTRPPVYQPNPGARPPVYQPYPGTRPPVYQPGTRPPVYQPGTRPPVYQPQPGTRPPVYQPGTRPPVYQPYPGTRPPVYQPNPGMRPPVYQPNPGARPPVFQPHPGASPPVFQPHPGASPPVFQPHPGASPPVFQPRPFQPSAPSPAPSRSWGTPSPSPSGGAHSWSPPAHTSSPAPSSSPHASSSNTSGGAPHHR